jgi:hypothetical protein
LAGAAIHCSGQSSRSRVALLCFDSLRSECARYLFAQAAAGWEKHAHSDSELARVYGRESSWGRAELERAARSRAANKRTENIERKRLELTALKASATEHRALSLELQVKAEVQQAISLKANRAKAAHRLELMAAGRVIAKYVRRFFERKWSRRLTRADRDISSEYARQLDDETQRLRDLRELGTTLSPHLAAAGVGGHGATIARAGPADAGGSTDATAKPVTRRSNSRSGFEHISGSLDMSPSTGRSQTVVTRMGAALSASFAAQQPVSMKSSSQRSGDRSASRNSARHAASQRRADEDRRRAQLEHLSRCVSGLGTEDVDGMAEIAAVSAIPATPNPHEVC